MWLLEWPVPWDDGNGYDRHFMAFEHKERALAKGADKVRQRCNDEPLKDRELTVRLFLMERDNGEYYAAGVTVRHVPYFPGLGP